jgi:hypothetical protein
MSSREDMGAPNFGVMGKFERPHTLQTTPIFHKLE